jgi:hypothetical protein
MPSTATIDGALAAIEARLAANWTTTPIVYDNDDSDGAVPPQVGDQPTPWVYCEIIEAGPATIHAFGGTGNQTVIDDGIIKLYVMVPKGSGLATGREYAREIGEIFRQQLFYTSDPTAYIRSGTPSVGRGDLTRDDGAWVSVACRIPFEFYHRA